MKGKLEEGIANYAVGRATQRKSYVSRTTPIHSWMCAANVLEGVRIASKGPQQNRKTSAAFLQTNRVALLVPTSWTRNR